MKTKYVQSLVGAVLSACLVSLSAFGAGANAPMQSAFESASLHGLTIGAAAEKQERQLALQDSGIETMLNARSYYGFAALDLVSWMTIEAGAGATEGKLPLSGEYTDMSVMWMVSARASLWQYELRDPEVLSSMLALDVSVSYWDHEVSEGAWELSWNEFRADLKLSAEILAAQPRKDQSRYPYSTIFSVGPVYSAIDAEEKDMGAKIDLEETEDFGIAYGVDVMIAPNLSVGYEGRTLDKTSHTLTVALRF